MSIIGEIGAGADPRHVFLDAREVMARYGWGKTKGYQNLKDRELVPPPVMRNPNRWRLDQLLTWEDHRIALTQEATSKPTEPNRGSDLDTGSRLAGLLPQPKQRRSA